jgi:hypothetical protein
MADIMTINDLIKQLIRLESDEVQEIQRLRMLLDQKEKELLENVTDPKK